jgi:hypothetical protein
LSYRRIEAKTLKSNEPSLDSMDIPVYFPNLKTGSTKDRIIQLLTVRKSLTNQKIFINLKNDYGLSKSYQTVRQALGELVEAGVLKKENKEYSISEAWILSLESYSRLLKSKFIDKREIRTVDGRTKEIILRSLNDLGHFILSSWREDFFSADKERQLFIYVHHLWFPFGDIRKREKLKEFFLGAKTTVYVSGSGIGDQILKQFYKRYCMIRLGRKIDEFFDYLIQGECIAKIYMPDELRKRMDKAYAFRRFDFSLIDEIAEMTQADYRIRIIITRDRQMADEIRSRFR